MLSLLFWELAVLLYPDKLQGPGPTREEDILTLRQRQRETQTERREIQRETERETKTETEIETETETETDEILKRQGVTEKDRHRDRDR